LGWVILFESLDALINISIPVQEYSGTGAIIFYLYVIPAKAGISCRWDNAIIWLFNA
jgi:hypothetical protein